MLRVLPFDPWSNSASTCLSLGELAKSSLPLLHFANMLLGMVRALSWEKNQFVGGRLVISVGADNDYFCNGIEPFINSFICFFCNIFL